MSNSMKGLVAGLVATIVLSVVMLINSGMGIMPEVDFIRLLRSLGTLSTPAAWMDHFIVGVVVWGLLFGIYDAMSSGPAPWLKGIIFGVFAWLVMLVAFMPLAGAGLFGAKLGGAILAGFLVLHLIYGAVLGVAYGLLALVPERVPEAPKQDAEGNDVVINPNNFSNDDLPSSSPSFRATVMLLVGLAGFISLIVFSVVFRSALWS